MHIGGMWSPTLSLVCMLHRVRAERVQSWRCREAAAARTANTSRCLWPCTAARLGGHTTPGPGRPHNTQAAGACCTATHGRAAARGARTASRCPNSCSCMSAWPRKATMSTCFCRMPRPGLLYTSPYRCRLARAGTHDAWASAPARSPCVRASGRRAAAVGCIRSLRERAEPHACSFAAAGAAGGRTRCTRRARGQPRGPWRARRPPRPRTPARTRRRARRRPCPACPPAAAAPGRTRLRGMQWDQLAGWARRHVERMHSAGRRGACTQWAPAKHSKAGCPPGAQACGAAWRARVWGLGRTASVQARLCGVQVVGGCQAGPIARQPARRGAR
jgi:hypothetical protein